MMMGRLINHGSIKLQLQHYSNKSFQDNHFYIVETKTHKEIIVGHLVSIRLGLIQVLCKNIAKSVAAIETSSKNCFQDHLLNIDDKILCRKQRSKSESNRDHSSSFSKRQAEKTQSETDRKTTPNDTGMSLSSKAPTESGRKETKLGSFKTMEYASQKWTHFKTPGTQTLTHFKTLAERVKRLNPKYMVLSWPSNPNSIRG